MRRLSLLVRSTCLLAALSGCAVQPIGSGRVEPLPVPGDTRSPPPGEQRPVTALTLPIARPQLKIGDRWVYAGREIGAAATYQTNLIERSIVSVGGDRAQLRQVPLDPATRKPNGPARLRNVRPSSWHLDPGGRSSGEVRALAFPLTLGKEWRYEYSVASGERDVVTTYAYVANVAGLDSVTTPAGRFDTVRVIHQGEWRRSVLEKGEPVMRTGGITQVYWYAPAVNSWVRLEVDLRRPDGSRELAIVQELVEYGRRR